MFVFHLELQLWQGVLDTNTGDETKELCYFCRTWMHFTSNHSLRAVEVFIVVNCNMLRAKISLIYIVPPSFVIVCYRA